MSQAGEIDVLGAHPEIPTEFITNSGTAIPILNQLEILGAGGIVTSGAGNTVTITGAAFGETITGDAGGALSPTLGNWNILGQAAGVVPVVFTNGAVSTLKVEDRTWQTQYVVDANTTAGLRGTYSTIASAITQAVADGASDVDQKTIYIRFGTYAENLTIPGGIHLKGEAVQTDPNSFFVTPIINGIHTLDVLGENLFERICFANSTASDTFTGNFVFVFVKDCVFNNTSTGKFFTLTGASTLSHIRSFFYGTAFASGFDIISGDFQSCNFNSMGITSGSGSIRLNDCQTVGPIVGSSTNIIARNCGFASNSTDNLSGSYGTCSLQDCFFTSNDGTTSAIGGTGTFNIHGIGIPSGVTGPLNLYNTTPTIQVGQSLSGNVIKSTKTAISYAVQTTDYYIGVTNTAAPRTITLPGSTCCTDRIFIVKDESGGAGTNNITVTVVGGVKTIDGATTFVINVNYGSITVIYDGTNYFII